MQRGDRVGIRCPICLGKTEVVAERTTERADGTFAASKPTGGGLRCVLDNVRSALNVGSIFRTAEGYGVEHLYLSGITPTPESPRVKKTGLDAQRGVPWSAHRNAVELVTTLKQHGCRICVLERVPDSKPIESLEPRPGSQRVLVVGNEQAGVDPGILELADEVVHLPMVGQKESFNVAVAFAIATHVLTRRN